MEGADMHMEQQKPQGSHKGGSRLSQAVLVVVILLVLVGLVMWFGGFGETREEIAPGQEKVTALRGRVVENFPPELLLEDDVEILESYSINYTDDGFEQPVVRYQSNLSLIDNYRLFRDFFRENGWSVQRDLDQNSNEDPISMYAVAEGADLNIIFSGREAGGVVVQLGYLKK